MESNSLKQEKHMIMKGEKILLRDWKESDFDLYRYYRRPEHKWHKYDGPYYPRQSDEKIQYYLNKVKEKIKLDDFEYPRQKLVLADIQTDKLIGLVNAYWESKETNWLNMGIGIYDDSLWGQGLGLETMTLWMNYLFEGYHEIVRLGFMTWSGNKGMIRLGQKLGMKEEARFRKARIVDGEYYDSLGYGILREEWQN